MGNSFDRDYLRESSLRFLGDRRLYLGLLPADLRRHYLEPMLADRTRICPQLNGGETATLAHVGCRIIPMINFVILKNGDLFYLRRGKRKAIGRYRPVGDLNLAEVKFTASHLLYDYPTDTVYLLGPTSWLCIAAISDPETPLVPVAAPEFSLLQPIFQRSIQRESFLHQQVRTLSLPPYIQAGYYNGFIILLISPNGPPHCTEFRYYQLQTGPTKG